jgi:hypothetical protein
MGNTEINTVEFWEEAKAGIEEQTARDKSDYYLCSASHKFCEMWKTQDGDEEITLLGRLFLIAEKQWLRDVSPDEVFIGHIYLFSARLNPETHKKIRLKFCDWNIERIKKGGADGQP